MRANPSELRKITARLTTRERMRRPPVSRRNRRLTAFRPAAIARVYSQGARRGLRGEPTGVNPPSSASWRGCWPHTPGPAPRAGSPAGDPTDGAVGGLGTQQGLGQANAHMSRRFAPLRHLGASQRARYHETCRRLVAWIFSPQPKRNELPNGTARLPLEAFVWEGIEHLIEDSVLRPAVHPDGEGRPWPN